ncbi:hypothetical protein NDA18_000719 [Ustilago nuda]|nr:hypothetical protein NDA18_000719 [Ustilago nuda]
MSSSHIPTDGEASSQRVSISSDHSKIPSNSQAGKHTSPSNDPVALPSTSTGDAPSPNTQPIAELDADSQPSLHGDHPTIRAHGRHLISRPNTASTTASFASALAEPPARPSIASAFSSCHTSPKKSGPSRIGRSFEALLASDETYVLKERSKVALDTEDSLDSRNGLTPVPALLGSPSGSNRVIVERRRQRSSSSLTSNGIDDIDEERADVIPRPPDAVVFQSSLQQPQPQPSTSTSTSTVHRSISRGISANGSQPPASPDRTTLLQRRLAASPSAVSTASTRKAAPISAMPALMLPLESESPGRARPRLSNSLGLEQEINSTYAADQGNSMGSFRQQMKKTSGFLRKLRKDNTPVRREKDAAKHSGFGSPGAAYSIGSNPSTTSLGRSEGTIGATTLGRRESKASVLSGSSATGSTSHSMHKQSALFTSTEGVAVPSIPERFMQHSSSVSSHITAPSTDVEPAMSERNPGVAADHQELAPSVRSGLRVPSAPATITEWGLAAKVPLPQRSSWQENDRLKSLGSSDSSGAIRLAIQQLESHMDDALKEDQAQKIQVAVPKEVLKPKQQWGPSPQLPDLDIEHYRERSGSFIEESDLVSSEGYDHKASYPTTPVTADSYPDNIRNGREGVAATGLGIVAGANFPGAAAGKAVENGAGEAATIKAPSKPNPPPLVGMLRRPSASNSAESPKGLSSSARSSQRNSIDPVVEVQVPRRTAHSGASLTSVRSFETAAESAGLDSADPKVTSFILPNGEKLSDPIKASYEQANGLEGSPLVKDGQRLPRPPQADGKNGANIADVSSHGVDADNNEDQEQSIRLVTKRSNTEDLNAESSPLKLGSTTIITAPASPGMGSTALPMMVELSEQSFLRPGRNGSISRGYSASSSSVRAGSGSLLRTPSVRTSPSPISSPTSARTSFDGAPRSATNDDVVATPAVALSAQELATKCWEEEPAFLKREKIAEWLGGLGSVNRAARTYYFANFDFSGLGLDVAFRRLCDKLFLRAETQQIDRILSAFSQRYYECNSDSVFGSSDVIHSVVFSILLLNTDLHIAKLQERMTRQQFVRNTLSAIAESSTDAPTVHAQDDGRSSFSHAHNDVTRSMDSFPQTVSAQHRNSISSYLGSRSKQTSSSTNLESSSDAQHPDSSRPGTAMSGNKSRDAEIETMLKDIYAAVKNERILLPSPEGGSGTVAAGRTSGTFAPNGGRRKVGKGSDRMTALKRGSIRGIQGLLGGMGSNPSLTEPSVNPNPIRSSVDPWGRTAQSLGVSSGDRMLSPLPSITPGFASTLTQTIIKESMEEEAAASGTVNSLFSKAENVVDEEEDDDKLALAGPPWAKEGSLTRKHYWEATGKRAKDKAWTEVFVVVSKGTLSMFRFDSGSSSASTGTSSKAKSQRSAAGAGIGGGNWLSNATCLGEIPLAHSLANALPPPGYNKNRPHVFALTLPGGKVYFFQTGHEELVNEWVSTCNYWAARQSKEPLAGGVSNMEYGWNKVLPQPSEDELEELDSFGDSSVSQHQYQQADARSIRSGKSSKRKGYSSPSPSSRDLNNGLSSAAPSISTSNNAGFMSNERTFINEWRTPQLPTVPSTLGEERQLARLEKQVATIVSELTLHNELRQPMLQLYSPHGANYNKALANWERKSNHLLQELVKYQSYVEALKRSGDLKAERRAEREVEGMIEDGDAMLAELRI